MRKKLIVSAICTFVFLAFVALIHAQDSGGKGELYNEIIGKFFSLIEDGEYWGAIEYIYSTNDWFSGKSDEIQTLRSQFTGLESLVGAYISHEILIEEKISDRLVYLVYFVAMERQPLSFSFQFYKPKDKWLFHSFAYSDEIDQWLEEKAKKKWHNKDDM